MAHTGELILPSHLTHKDYGRSTAELFAAGEVFSARMDARHTFLRAIAPAVLSKTAQVELVENSISSHLFADLTVGNAPTTYLDFDLSAYPDLDKSYILSLMAQFQLDEREDDSNKARRALMHPELRAALMACEGVNLTMEGEHLNVDVPYKLDEKYAHAKFGAHWSRRLPIEQPGIDEERLTTNHYPHLVGEYRFPYDMMLVKVHTEANVVGGDVNWFRDEMHIGEGEPGKPRFTIIRTLVTQPSNKIDLLHREQHYPEAGRILLAQFTEQGWHFVEDHGFEEFPILREAYKAQILTMRIHPLEYATQLVRQATTHIPQASQALPQHIIQG